VASITEAGATTVSISANDTTPAVLATKLVAGTGITLTENNDGGNETLTVAAAGDVAGPGGSTDNAWARWSGSAGLAIQNGKWVEADTGAVTAGGDLDMSGYDLTVDFSTIEAAGEHAEEIDANATGDRHDPGDRPDRSPPHAHGRRDAAGGWCADTGQGVVDGTADDAGRHGRAGFDDPTGELLTYPQSDNAAQEGATVSADADAPDGRAADSITADTTTHQRTAVRYAGSYTTRRSSGRLDLRH
jgi:hypothetical protein